MRKQSVAVVGAGPAGLTASWKLSEAGANVCVFEADPIHVGGIARTVEYKGFRFDIGGHRFFSKSREIEELWTELLGDDLLTRPRSSRILYGGKFFSYPLKALEAFLNLGPLETTRCIASYCRAKLFPRRPVVSFEDWVCNQFGERLFKIFFKTYTEKVWGMKCSEISADWAQQRITGLSLAKAIREAMIPTGKGNRDPGTVKTLIQTFRYPRLGPGMMWQSAAARTQAAGGSIRMGTEVTRLERLRQEKKWRVHFGTSQGGTGYEDFDHVISSAPLRQVVGALSPQPAPETLRAAGMLRYRDFLTVALIVERSNRFTDNWIYIHDPSVRVGRIQNFGSWSEDMVPDSRLACYGLEYFCFEGDGLWTQSNESLIALAVSELQQLGLAEPREVLDGTVIRQAKAYPVYDDEYLRHVATIRGELKANYPDLHLVGRNGMHKYNNQDHSMMTALLTARNILSGKEEYDVWQVNQDAEYHEAISESESSSGRLIPRRRPG
jgi:protoporphyrinogen oxidase